MEFQDLQLDDWLIKLCQKVNYKKPTPIQQLAIKPILRGASTLISAETGSGKTAAFAFPILQQLSRDPYGIYALILTANRELALQIGEQCQIFGAALNLRVTLLIGGMPLQQQLFSLTQIPHIVVATPGRCAELLRTDSLFQKNIQNIKFLVLDEVDRLMENQVWSQVEDIRSHLPAEQFTTHLVSATLQSVHKSKEGYQSLAECFPGITFTECTTTNGLKVADTIQHKYILMPQLVKDYYLIYLLNKIQDTPTIVFVSTCHKCQELSLILQKVGIDNIPLHSMLKQQVRIQNLRKFRTQKVSILICTDVASRGLDIPDVKYIVNWNVPATAEDYIHRVGRTGRNGKSGTGITLMTQFDVEKVLAIETEIGVKLTEIKFKEEKVLEDMSSLTKVMRKIKIQMAQDGTTENLRKKQSERKQLKQKSWQQASE